MKYAICNEMFVGWEPEKVFRYVKSCGYSGIEIAPFTLADSVSRFSTAMRERWREQIVDAGLECVGLHWLLAKTSGYHLTKPDDLIREATGDYLAELAQLCADLGGKIMVLGSPQQRNLLEGVTHERAMDLAAQAIRRAVPVLEGLDITLALEALGPSEGDFLNTAESAIELAQMIDSPKVRLHLDVKAMSAEEKPIDEIIRESREWISHFHANDPNLLGPGMGSVEFESIFAALRDVDYQEWVSVEVFDYTPGVERICEESIAYMKRIVRV